MGIVSNIEVKDRYIPQYALLTVMEGLHIALEGKTRCEYIDLYPTFESSNGRKTLWGSSTDYVGMRKVNAAVRLRYNDGIWNLRLHLVELFGICYNEFIITTYNFLFWGASAIDTLLFV